MEIARIVARCLWEEQRLLQTASTVAQVERAPAFYLQHAKHGRDNLGERPRPATGQVRKGFQRPRRLFSHRTAKPPIPAGQW